MNIVQFAGQVVHFKILRLQSFCRIILVSVCGLKQKRGKATLIVAIYYFASIFHMEKENI